MKAGLNFILYMGLFICREGCYNGVVYDRKDEKTMKNRMMKIIIMKNRVAKNAVMFFALIILAFSVTLSGCTDKKGEDGSGANTENRGGSKLPDEGDSDDVESKPEENGPEGEDSSGADNAGGEEDSSETDSAEGEEDKKGADTSDEKTEVRREDFPDCDGSGHGYVEIHYSDGSTEIEEY